MKDVLLPPTSSINGLSVSQLMDRLKTGEILSYWYVLIGVDVDPVLLYKGRCVTMTVAPEGAGVYIQVPDFVSNDFVNSHFHGLWIVHPAIDPQEFFEDWREQLISSMPQSWQPVGLERAVIKPVTTVSLDEIIEQPNSQPL